MPAVDPCHTSLKRALQLAGLQIESDPFYVVLEGRAVHIDLELTRPDKDHPETLIVMEMKCFPDRNSTTQDVYVAIGRCLVQRTALERAGLPYTVYLAVPDAVYQTLFDSVVMQAIAESHIKLVVINLATEEVMQWIE